VHLDDVGLGRQDPTVALPPRRPEGRARPLELRALRVGEEAARPRPVHPPRDAAHHHQLLQHGRMPVHEVPRLGSAVARRQHTLADVLEDHVMLLQKPPAVGAHQRAVPVAPNAAPLHARC